MITDWNTAREVDWLGKEIIRPGRHRGLFSVVIAGGCQQDTDAGRGAVQFRDKFKPGPIGQTKIDDHRRGAIDLKMAPSGFQAIGATDARPAAQAQKTHGFAGVTAVFHRQDRQAQQRTAGSRHGVGLLKRIRIGHDKVPFDCLALG